MKYGVLVLDNNTYEQHIYIGSNPTEAKNSALEDGFEEQEIISVFEIHVIEGDENSFLTSYNGGE